MLPFLHFRQNLFYFFLLVNSKTNKKIFPQRPPHMPQFQHLILQFGRKNKRMLQKIKTK